MVNTEEKYGIRNRTAILLFVQMVLIKFGLLLQIIMLVIEIINNMDGFLIANSIAMIAAHTAITIYSYLTRNKARAHYFVAFGFTLAAVLVNVITPGRDIAQLIMLTLLFGVLTAFLFKQEDYKITNTLIIIAGVLALAYCVYSVIVLRPDPTVEEKYKELVSIAMYMATFAPVVLVATFGVAYNAKYEKAHHASTKELEQQESK